MTRDAVVASLRAAYPSLRKEFGLRSMSRFGSVARDDDNPASDVDLLVEFDSTQTVTLFTLARLQDRLCRLLGREVDVGTPASLRPRVREQVQAEVLRVA